MDLDDKVALVTGAGSGIGLAIASALLSRGAVVTLVHHIARPANWPGNSDRQLPLRGDLTDPGFPAACIDKTVERFGRLDWVVNAAGLFEPEVDRSIVDVDLADFERIFRVNFTTPMLVARQAIPLMVDKGGGVLLHIASIAGLRTVDNLLSDGPHDAYQTSKAALISLSRSLALTYGSDGIRSNTISPGSIDTPMTEVFYRQPSRVAAMEARTPLARIGCPEDVAAACLFLLSDEARFITGVDLQVDGGLLAKLG